MHDVVLAHRLEHTPSWPALVTVLPLIEEPLDVALPAGHQLARLRTVPAVRAAADPWVTTHAGFPVGAILDSLSAVAGRRIKLRYRGTTAGHAWLKRRIAARGPQPRRTARFLEGS